MGILIFIVVVLVVLGLACWLISMLPGIPPQAKMLISVVAVAAAIVIICQRAGFF